MLRVFQFVFFCSLVFKVQVQDHSIRPVSFPEGVSMVSIPCFLNI